MHMAQKVKLANFLKVTKKLKAKAGSRRKSDSLGKG